MDTNLLNELVETHIMGNDRRATDAADFEDATRSGFVGYFRGACPAWVYKWNGNDHSLLNDSDLDWDAEMAWEEREGKPYQADLEAHVAAWKRPVRDFCGDLNLCWEMESKLQGGPEWLAYCDIALHLVIFNKPPDKITWRGCIHATAREKVEAALRTVGQWPEGAS